IIYAGSYNGLFKTTSGAAKWSRLDLGLQDRTVSSLAIDPASPDVVYAGTDAGVQKSADGGKHWALIPLPLISPIINALVVDPSSGALYVGSGAGLLRVTNGN
ncbi:MAG TPA: hypothetical protein VLZ81_08460, partial [Blastocatellia bacterium]|nr:hypothetical protein [Blastocatellia bacterium]